MRHSRKESLLEVCVDDGFGDRILSMQRVYTPSCWFRFQKLCRNPRTNCNWTRHASSCYSIFWALVEWKLRSIHDNAKSKLVGSDILKEESLRGWVTSQRSRTQPHEFWITFGKIYCKRKWTFLYRDLVIPYPGNPSDAVRNSNESSAQFKRFYSLDKGKWHSCLWIFRRLSFCRNLKLGFRRQEDRNSRTRIVFNAILKEARRWSSSIASILKFSYWKICAIQGHTGGNLMTLSMLKNVLSDTVNWQTRQWSNSTKYLLPCLDDHHFKEEELNFVGELSKYAHKLFRSACTWLVLVDLIFLWSVNKFVRAIKKWTRAWPRGWGPQGMGSTGGGGPARVPNLRVCKHFGPEWHTQGRKGEVTSCRGTV